jgi:hypothetical protein
MTYSAEQVVAKLKKIQGDRSLREFAKELNISAPYLSDVYKNRREPGPAVLKVLGLEKMVLPSRYARKEDAA